MELTKGELIALETFLSAFPKFENFQKVEDLIFDNSDEILVWEPFEEWPREDLLEQISLLAMRIDREIEAVKIL